MFNFPEHCKVVLGLGPCTAAGGEVAGTAISLKNVEKLWVNCYVNTAGTSAAVALVPQTHSDVAFGTPAVLTTAVRIWANQNTGAGDRLVEQSAAVNFTTTAADANTKQVIFEIDPADLTAGEDCFRIDITALAATDYACCEYVILPRYGNRAATIPSVLTD